MPMSADFCGKVCSIQNSLNNPSHKGSAVEAALVFGDGDEGVDQRILLNDVIRPLVVIGVLQFVSLLPKQSFPQSGLHHQQGVEKLELSLGRPVPDKHEVQDPGSHLEPDREACPGAQELCWTWPDNTAQSLRRGEQRPGG